MPVFTLKTYPRWEIYGKYGRDMNVVTFYWFLESSPAVYVRPAAFFAVCLVEFTGKQGVRCLHCLIHVLSMRA